MRATDPLPAPIGWITRFIGWTVGLLIIGGILYGYGSFTLMQSMEACLQQLTPPEASALESVKEFVACLDRRAGPLESLMLRQDKKMIAALPNAPCRFIGIWNSTRDSAVHKITLTEDSKFVAEPSSNTPAHAERITGSWGVYQDKMIWLYDDGHFWPPDINPIKDPSDDGFTLIERNGSRTRFALVDRVGLSSCTP